jgi:transmembrane sensor
MDSKYKQYFLQIIQKYNKGTATNEEIEFLENYYNAFELNDDLVTNENEADYQDVKQSIKNKIDQRIAHQDTSKTINIRSWWLKYAAVAVILISTSIGLYFIVKPGNKKNQQINAAQLILPGGNKAMLTLSNGTRILLDDARNGKIANQSNVSITKTNGNQIVYAVASGSNSAGDQQEAYHLQNTISTPNGGQYALVLPDGTKVMLNAASSLTYPASFHGKERLVQLDGEAYFEVAKNKDMPFKVKSGTQTVEVLGTHFNINAYPDEASIKTTLLEGSVKISSGTNSTLIVPGQQAAVSTRGAAGILKYAVDVDKETAWKNGLFEFQNDDLKSIMRQVARWYDVKVIYADNLSNEKFIGEISRTSNLSDVFKILELNNVHFEVEGKTVTVSAK